jgi:membrane protein required for colicin V production
MSWLDIVVIILLIISLIGGFATGLIKSLFSLIGLVVGVVLAGHYYAAFAGNLGFISNPSAARIVAFAIIFVVVMIIAAILGILFTKLVSAILLGWLNRLLGAIFGLILGAIFISAILAIWVKYAGGGGAVEASALGQFLLQRFPIILGLLPKEFDTVRQFLQ